MRLAQTVKYKVATPVAKGVRVTLLDAGHLPGSASVLFDVTLAGRRRRVLFSGDLGNSLSPLLTAPRPAPPCDAVFVETTYGAAHRDASVARAAGGVPPGGGRDGPRGRRGVDSLLLARPDAKDSLRVAPCPAGKAAAVADSHLLPLADGPRGRPRSTTRIAATAGSRPRSPPTRRPSRRRQVEKTVPSPDDLPRPSIIISTSDILGAAWMRRMLASLLPEESTRILMVSYQDPDSPAGLLKRGRGVAGDRREDGPGPREGAIVPVFHRPRRRQGHRRLAGPRPDRSDHRPGSRRQAGACRPGRAASPARPPERHRCPAERADSICNANRRGSRQVYANPCPQSRQTGSGRHCGWPRVRRPPSCEGLVSYGLATPSPGRCPGLSGYTPSAYRSPYRGPIYGPEAAIPDSPRQRLGEAICAIMPHFARKGPHPTAQGNALGKRTIP